MRIALFSDTFFQINGVSMVYQRFARWAGTRGMNIEIFTPGSNPVFKLGSVTVHSIEIITRVPYYHDLYYDALPVRPKVERYFKTENFDLVHIATQGHMAIIGLRAAGVQGTPKVSCYHTKMPEYAASRFLRFFGRNRLGYMAADVAKWLSWWYQRQLYRSSNLILVPTESARALIEEQVNVPTAVFSRGVDSEAFSPAHREERGLKTPVTLYVGRLSVEKNLELLSALGGGDGEGLVLVGDGPDKKELMKKLPRARFAGFLTGGTLQREYASADIFAFPSKTETFGNAVLEAMSSGLPVIVTGEGGPKDFVADGETGFVARSDEEFVDRHRRLAADPGLRKMLGANAREYAKTQDWDYVFENQLIGNYQAVLSGLVL